MVCLMQPSNGEIEGPNVGKSDNKGRPLMIAGFLSHRVYYLYHRGWMNAAVSTQLCSYQARHARVHHIYRALYE
jgi:hypothetical protein